RRGGRSWRRLPSGTLASGRRGQRGRGEDDPVVAKDVVGVELGGEEALDVGQVAERPVCELVVAVKDEQHLALEVEGGQRLSRLARLRGLEVPAFDDGDP